MPDRYVPDRYVPDRYGDAVRSRRAELKAQRALLTGGHRAELRSCLALSRLTATGAMATTLAELVAEAHAHAEATGRGSRAQLPELVVAALAETAASVHAEWSAAVGPGLRRIATTRLLALPAAWPRLPDPEPLDLPPAPRNARRSWAPGDSIALWRLALLPAAALPVLGAPAPAGPALAPLAVGIGLTVAVVAVRARCATADRAWLRRHIDELVAAARAGMDADLGRRLVELERTAGVDLDAAVLARRSVVDAELHALAPDRPVEVPHA